VEVREAAQRWAEVWERGWREHDREAIEALYADERFGSSIPFASPSLATSFVSSRRQESAHCEFDVPLVDGDRATVPWKGQTRLVDGGTEDLVGVSLLRFDDDGLIVEQRDIWVAR
jgi:hypothetical protein